MNRNTFLKSASDLAKAKKKAERKLLKIDDPKIVILVEMLRKFKSSLQRK